MNLNQIAQQAMDYLDSVGIAADYNVYKAHLTIETDSRMFIYHHHHRHVDLISLLKARYPQKSPD